MSNIPSQIRSVDPFASYHSNNVNRLTQIISKGENIILGRNSVEVSISDSTSTDHIVISSGYIIKDHVLIHFDSDTTVDMTDSDYYTSGTTPFDENGVYYITIDYTYIKTKPAPEAGIIILKPSQTGDITQDRYLFIGAVDVIDSEISEVYGYDPDNPDIERNYDLSTTLTDEIKKNLELYGIFIDDDEELRYEGQIVDTRVEFDSNVSNYDLVYKNPDDDIYYRALADDTIKQNAVGIADVDNNRVMFAGLVQTDLSYDAGVDLYLSDSNAGEYTDTLTTLQIGTTINDTGLILLNIGAGGGSGGTIGDPYRNALSLENERTYTIPSGYGAVVPDRYVVHEDSELIVEDDAVFTII